MLKYKFIKIP